MQGKQQGAGRAGRTWIRLAVVIGLLASLLGTSVATSPSASAAGGTIYGPFLGKFYGSFAPQLGANGNVVAFASWLWNFDPSAAPFSFGVYYRDRTTGTTGAATVPISGTSPNGTSWPLGISPDPSGSRILFRSAASNLVPGDTLGHQDVFLFNRLTGTTERVSIADNEAEANGPSLSGAMSGNTATGDPRYVVFGSYASNLVPGDTNGVADVFIRDRVAGTTERVSVGTGGVQGNGDSLDATVSDDGRYVAFASSASNLVPGDTNNTIDIFVRDRVAGTTERVSVGYLGQASGSSTVPRISADGRFVAFDSDADDIVPLDDNFSTDVFVRDRLDGYTERVSVATSGLEGWGDSASPSMSRDGRYIAFESDVEEEFNPDDGNISVDIYVRDRLARVTQRASERSTGAEAFADSWSPSISPEGRYVAFYSDTDEFCNGCDSNEDDDVYIKDMGSSWLTQPVGGRFRGITPKLLLDTSTGPVPQGRSVGAKLASGETFDVRVAGGSTTVPANATAVVLNVTSSDATASGAYVSVFPTGENRKTSAALHPQVGAAVSNQVIVKVGSGGQVRFWTSKGATHLRAEVVGYFAPDDGDAFTPVTEFPLLDTRTNRRPAGWPAQQPLAAGGPFSQFDLKVTDTSGVPSDARAVALHVTSTSSSTSGSRITVRPTGTPNPGTANVISQVGPSVTNLVLVPVGTGGRVTVSINSGATHVVVSVVGWFGPNGQNVFFPMNPTRILDTKSSDPSLGIPGRSGPLGQLGIVFAPLVGRAGVPTYAHSIALSTSSVDATSALDTLITVPPMTFPVLVPSVNYRTSTNVTNTLLQRVQPDGGMIFINFGLGTVHLLGDAFGYYR